MTFEATQVLLVALPPAGAAALDIGGAGVNDLALQLGQLHGMEAADTCELVKGLLP